MTNKTPDWLDPATLRWVAACSDKDVEHYRRKDWEAVEYEDKCLWRGRAGQAACMARSLRNRATRLERRQRRSEQ